MNTSTSGAPAAQPAERENQGHTIKALSVTFGDCSPGGRAKADVIVIPA